MNYKIVSDSSSNIIHFNEHYTSVPMKINTIIKEYIDDENLELDEMIDYLHTATDKTNTSCPNVGDYQKAFNDEDNIFVFTISSNLSGSYNAARIAKEEYEHPIEVFDSLSAGPEIALQIEKMDEIASQCDTFDEACEKMKEYQTHTHLVFCLKSIQNLVNNGRVPAIVAKAIGLLGIRIIGKASDEGSFQVLGKSKGKSKTIAGIYKEMEKHNYHGGKVIINHVRNESEANGLKDYIHKSFPEAVVEIFPCSGLCSYYAEYEGLMIGFEDL